MATAIFRGSHFASSSFEVVSSEGLYGRYPLSGSTSSTGGGSSTPPNPPRSNPLLKFAMLVVGDCVVVLVVVLVVVILLVVKSGRVVRGYRTVPESGGTIVGRNEGI